LLAMAAAASFVPLLSCAESVAALMMTDAASFVPLLSCAESVAALMMTDAASFVPLLSCAAPEDTTTTVAETELLVTLVSDAEREVVAAITAATFLGPPLGKSRRDRDT